MRWSRSSLRLTQRGPWKPRKLAHRQRPHGLPVDVHNKPFECGGAREAKENRHHRRAGRRRVAASSRSVSVVKLKARLIGFF